MEIVVNSWFSEYLEETDTGVGLQKLNTFVSKFLKTNDKIIIQLNGQLDLKIRSLEKKYQNHGDTSFIKRIRKIYRTVYLDSNKCKFVNEMTLSEELELFFNSNSNFEKDKFLFKSALQAREKLIVTTDTRLKSQMNGKAQVRICLLDEFLLEYIK